MNKNIENPNDFTHEKIQAPIKITIFLNHTLSRTRKNGNFINQPFMREQKK